ncbi:MAG: DUF1259 domain-containing protein [Nitrososphaeraceae archaeon]|nr:DUF1259 domain-containing protein [Nitrososphaeraceae archaeon]MBV9667507.1 DUF1259 domain-containing protein [Nitrososphaeraceae archaeon]
MIKCTERKSEARTSSGLNRIFATLVISISMLSATIMLSTMTDNSFAQGSNANGNATSSSSSGGGLGTAAAGMSLNCQSIASTIGGIVVPNPSKICDMLILRQSPIIMGPGNMNMNKFSTANSIVEVAALSDLMPKTSQGGGSGGTSGAGGGGGNSSSSNNTSTGGGGRTISGSASSGSASSSTNTKRVFVMGEFALLESQLVPMVKAAVGSNWTIAAVHNHMVLEKPKMIFVHWSAQGDLNTITRQIKNVLTIVSKVPSSSGQ